ncbi:MAG TPA: class I SAM-dependent methyltransferase [Blastocatellia bacterium]|nr:class I SAM-dependent methyltransferase [Blastocatellia bacterium]
MGAVTDREKDFHNKAYADDSRRVVGKYYSISRRSDEFYQQTLDSCAGGKKVLEYGCGTGSYAFFLAQNGATVTGIDISDVAVNLARQQANRRRLDGLDFRVMNAEQLDFGDDSFDVICGTGILHHLQLDRAYAELSRTLKPEGRAVFVEPLGHNALINLYRKRTPELRTEDEHPLLMRDVRLAGDYFGSVKTRFFHLTSLAGVPLRRVPGFTVMLGFFEAIDRLLFMVLPFLKRYAWVVVLELAKPRKPAGGMSEH